MIHDEEETCRGMLLPPVLPSLPLLACALLRLVVLWCGLLPAPPPPSSFRLVLGCLPVREPPPAATLALTV